MGRPEKKIDRKQVFELAKIGCTYAEIASVVGCGKATLHSRFRTTIRKGHQALRRGIRRMQLKTAKRGNIAMQIWLGKQYLDQRDKRDIEKRVTTDVRIAIRETAVLRIELQKDPEYLDYLRSRTGEGDGHPRLMGPGSQPMVGDGSSPRAGGPGPDGDGNGEG